MLVCAISIWYIDDYMLDMFFPLGDSLEVFLIIVGAVGWIISFYLVVPEAFTTKTILTLLYNFNSFSIYILDNTEVCIILKYERKLGLFYQVGFISGDKLLLV